MLTRRLTVGAAVLLLHAPALAADVKTQLTKAEAAYASLDLATASNEARGVIDRGHLSHDELVRATRILALSNAARDQADAARDNFVTLLTLDPTYVVDPKLGPSYRQPFNEAKGFWSAQSTTPGIEASAQLRGRGVASLRVITHDPTGIAKTVTVAWRWSVTAAYQSRVVREGDSLVDVAAPPPNATRIEFYAKAEDAAASIVFEAGSAAAPKVAVIPVEKVAAAEKRSIVKSPWFWVIGGALVAGGATALVLALTQGGSSTNEWRPVFNCGGVKCE